MKRLLSIIMIAIMAICMVGCEEEIVPVEKELEVLSTVKGTSLQKTHNIENWKFVTNYDTGEYFLNRWRITDSKVINITAEVEGLPKGATVLIEHAHIDMSLKSTNPQLDGLSQDSMDDSYHGTSQDGFMINDKYSYQNIFAIEGFSKDLIDGWGFVTGSYGTSSLSQTRLTEENLVTRGNVYANKMQVVYDLLIKYPGEDYFHTVSVLDEFLIPVTEAQTQEE